MNEPLVQEIGRAKKELRNQIRVIRNGLTNESLLQTAFLAGDWFSEYIQANGVPKALLSYVDANKEVPTYAINQYALRNNIPLFLPRVLGKRSMCFVLVSDLSKLVSGAYGILEPELSEQSLVICTREQEGILTVNCQKIILEETEDFLMLVPGLAFDKEQYRLGYGGGYYDAYLNAMKNAGINQQSIALAYHFQIFSDIPKEPHDARVDYIKVFPVL